MAFQLHYGRKPAELGVKFVNISPGDAKQMPKGLDSVATWGPFSMAMTDINKTGVTLFDSDGLTGKHHKLGPKKELPGLKFAWAYPEGYHASRGPMVVRRNFAEKHPDLVTAFLLAHQEAVKYLYDRPKLAAELSNRWWKFPSLELVEEHLRRSMHYGMRDWVWFTEGEAAAFLYCGNFLYEAKVIKNPVSWETIRAYTEPIVPAIKKAYDQSGQYPPQAEFTRVARDIRGFPIWEVQKWNPNKWEGLWKKQDQYIENLRKKPISELITE